LAHGGVVPHIIIRSRAHGSENLRPVPQKDFCNTIGTKPTSLSPWPMSDAEGKADIELSMLEVSF
jgi:hypothetical protein